MKNSMKLFIFIISFVLVLAGQPLFSQMKKCCITGEYKGFHQDLKSITCKEPGEGNFTMYIEQEKGCGSKIWGKIVDPVGPSVMKFEGTVKPGPGKCCTIHGIAKNATEKIKFKTILCKMGTKWVSKKGKYKHSNGCTGKFEIKQL